MMEIIANTLPSGERAFVEGEIRAALGERMATGVWEVSLLDSARPPGFLVVIRAPERQFRRTWFFRARTEPFQAIIAGSLASAGI